MPLLSIAVFAPAVAAIILVMLIPKDQDRAACHVTLITSLVVFLLLAGLAAGYDPDSTLGQFQYVDQAQWIPSIGATYLMAADGLSLVLGALTALLTVLVAVNGLKAGAHYSRIFYALLLVLETGVLGSFFALDLLLFYIFWEVMLIPLYFLIAFWGSENRIYASIKFFAFTLAGSLLMLVGFLALYFYYGQATGIYTFNVIELYNADLPLDVQRWIFFALFMGFAIKVPVFPFHTWLPDAHTEAPTAGSVLLAGVLLKVGIYGFIRFSLPILPAAMGGIIPVHDMLDWMLPEFMDGIISIFAVTWAEALALLGILGILIGSLAAIAQNDAKRLVAYSSVGHMGLIVLGLAALNAQGLQGASLQMINHGIATGGLFFCVGMLYDRRHTRLIKEYGGIAKVMPVFAVLFTLVILSSVGLPGLCGFTGELIILLGVTATNAGWASVAVLGVILSAVYLLWMYQRVMQGPINSDVNRNLKDLVPAEVLTLLPIVLISLWIGLFPQPFLDRFEPAAARILMRAGGEIRAAEVEGLRVAEPLVAAVDSVVITKE